MPELGYDQFSYKIDGQRVFIKSGAIHYFRLPGRDLWIDRLSKLKYAGCNTVDIYFPWSYHSPAEDQYDFTGCRDVADLLAITQELGLYVIARPGPYINAELSAGGLPLWLIRKPNVTLRNRIEGEFSYCPEYMKYIKGWYETIIPIINQFDNVILFQIENEYATLEVEPDYMEELRDLSRSLGVKAPLMHNDMHAAGLYADIVDIYAIDNYSVTYFDSDWRSFPEVFVLLDNLEERIRPFCPHSPLFIAEFQAGWFDSWGGISYDAIRQHLGTEQINIITKTVISQGSTMYSHYMASGGTSWNNMGSSEVYTSYDFAGLICESGEPSPTFYTIKNINLFLDSFDLTHTESCVEDRCLIKTLGHETVYISIRKDQDNNKWIFLRNNAMEQEYVTLWSGIVLDIKPQEMVILPYNYSERWCTILCSTMPFIAKLKDHNHLSFFVQGQSGGEIHLSFDYGFTPEYHGNNAVLQQNEAVWKLKYPDATVWSMNKFVVEDQKISVYILPEEVIDSTFRYHDTLISGIDFCVEHQGKTKVAMSSESEVTVWTAGTMNSYGVCVDKPTLEKIYPANILVEQKDLTVPVRPSSTKLDMDSNAIPDGYALYKTQLAAPLTKLLIDARHCYAVYLNEREIGYGNLFDLPKEEDPPAPVAYTIDTTWMNDTKNELVVLVRSLGHTKGFDDDTQNPRGLLQLTTFPEQSLQWEVTEIDPVHLPSAQENTLSVPYLVQMTCEFNIPDFAPFYASKNLVIHHDAIQQADIYLNGRLIGHYIKELGPQNRFYLPESFLVEGGNIVSLILWQRGQVYPLDDINNIIITDKLYIEFGEIYKYIPINTFIKA